MIEVILNKLGEKPSRKRIAVAIGLIGECISHYDWMGTLHCELLLKEISSVCEGQNELAKQNLARCLAFGERAQEWQLDRESEAVFHGIAYRLWSIIQFHDDYDFWVRIARVLTNPAVLPEIKRKIPILMSFRDERGIYGTEEQIYRDAQGEKQR